MENGWIKIHRKLKEKAYYKKSAYVHLWIHLLLSANHDPKEFMWNQNIMVVKEGQLITGRKELSVQTGIPETTVERILDFLEKDHQIGQQKTVKFRLITIVNWKTWQKVDNRRTTDGQQTDTNKNIKKDKKENTAQAPTPFSLKEELEKMKKDTRRHIQLIGEYLEEKKIPIASKPELNVAIRRHCRDAVSLAAFDDNRIGWATGVAEKEYKQYTLGTLVKILTR